MGDQKILKVGELKSYLEKFDPQMEITFGSSKYRKRPLIFYRFKIRGEKLLHIEITELEKDMEPISEIDCRPTVESFLEHLAHWEDDSEITFGCSIDAVPFEFRNVKPVVAINIEQNEEPVYRVQGD